jgi:hypothetical protein
MNLLQKEWFDTISKNWNKDPMIGFKSKWCTYEYCSKILSLMNKPRGYTTQEKNIIINLDGSTSISKPVLYYFKMEPNTFPNSISNIDFGDYFMLDFALYENPFLLNNPYPLLVSIRTSKL